MSNVQEFGVIDGETVYKVSLAAGNIKGDFITFGASIQSLWVLDKTGKLLDVSLGYDTAAEYKENAEYLGAVLGPVCGRIRAGKFTMDSVEYQCPQSRGGHCLHGGELGLTRKNWAVLHVDASRVTFAVYHADGEEGFPGNRTITITYALEAEGLLHMHYAAMTDTASPVNITQHVYFNLEGEGPTSVDKHVIRVACPKIAEFDNEFVATGKISDVAGTLFDLRKGVVVGDFKKARGSTFGFDVHYLTDEVDPKTAIAECYTPVSGVKLEMFSDQCGVLLYSGGNLHDIKGKAGHVYQQGGGICIESQAYPDPLNHTNSVSNVLVPENSYSHKTTYRFSIL